MLYSQKGYATEMSKSPDEILNVSPDETVLEAVSIPHIRTLTFVPHVTLVRWSTIAKCVIVPQSAVASTQVTSAPFSLVPAVAVVKVAVARA